MFRACITSIVRLKYIVSFGDSKDPTWDDAIAAIWSLIEISVATLCACLPAMRYLFARWLPALFDINSTKRSKSNAKSNPLANPFSSTSSAKRSQYDKIGPSISSSHRIDITPGPHPPFPHLQKNAPVTKSWVGKKEAEVHVYNGNLGTDSWGVADGVPLEKVKISEVRVTITDERG